MSYSLSVQEAAASFANNQLNEMNMAALEMYGVDVLWFRATPQERSSDVIFQAYTLHNVEQCPLQTKVMYTDTNYDEAALTFSFNGIEYKPTLTLEIPIGAWSKITNFDGTLPQKKDIVYVPMTKKLWQVSSMTPVAALGGQVTSYKMLMESYKPEADRLIGSELQTAIDENTVSVDKLFGKAIDDAMKDLTDKPQLANTSSTERDKFKTLTRNISGEDILSRNSVIQTIQGNLEIDGHLVARSYYDMNMTNDIVVEYKNINDSITKESTRCLSLWVSPVNNSTSSYKIDSIKVVKKDNNYTYIEITGDNTKDLSLNDSITIFRNGVTLSGIVKCTDSSVCVQIPNTIISIAEETSEEWYNLKNYKYKSESKINLLTGVCDEGNMYLNLVARRYIELILPNNANYICDTDIDMEYDNWYGIIINVSDKLNVNIFEPKEQLTRTFENSVSIKNIETTYNRYFITHSNSYITNIRLYTLGNYDIDKQLTDLVSYNIKDNSLAVINDSADVYLGLKYYGEQR